MGWQGALVGATAFAGYQQAGASGKFNQSVENRNALVQEQNNEEPSAALRMCCFCRVSLYFNNIIFA